ncbi:hypothetical protein HK101_009994 [Irineochytrium annulatum]|nr:hypothetical protein HK101_009994 [Irineochytrium annulatum]
MLSVIPQPTPELPTPSVSSHDPTALSPAISSADEHDDEDNCRIVLSPDLSPSSLPTNSRAVNAAAVFKPKVDLRRERFMALPGVLHAVPSRYQCECGRVIILERRGRPTYAAGHYRDHEEACPRGKRYGAGSGKLGMVVGESKMIGWKGVVDAVTNPPGDGAFLCESCWEEVGVRGGRLKKKEDYDNHRSRCGGREADSVVKVVENENGEHAKNEAIKRERANRRVGKEVSEGIDHEVRGRPAKRSRPAPKVLRGLDKRQIALDNLPRGPLWTPLSSLKWGEEKVATAATSVVVGKEKSSRSSSTDDPAATSDTASRIDRLFGPAQPMANASAMPLARGRRKPEYSYAPSYETESDSLSTSTPAVAWSRRHGRKWSEEISDGNMEASDDEERITKKSLELAVGGRDGGKRMAHVRREMMETTMEKERKKAKARGGNLAANRQKLDAEQSWEQAGTWPLIAMKAACAMTGTTAAIATTSAMGLAQQSPTNPAAFFVPGLDTSRSAFPLPIWPALPLKHDVLLTSAPTTTSASQSSLGVLAAEDVLAGSLSASQLASLFLDVTQPDEWVHVRLDVGAGVRHVRVTTEKPFVTSGGHWRYGAA